MTFGWFIAAVHVPNNVIDHILQLGLRQLSTLFRSLGLGPTKASSIIELCDH